MATTTPSEEGNTATCLITQANQNRDDDESIVWVDLWRPGLCSVFGNVVLCGLLYW